MDLIAVLDLNDWETATRLVRETPRLIEPGSSAGALHLMAKRGHVAAVKWLLDHGAEPNARWAHWDADVTPLHLAAAHGHTDVVRLLLAAGADPSIRDSKHDSDVVGWAEHFQKPGIIQILKAHAASS
jgi:ankyrin repeat protein